MFIVGLLGWWYTNGWKKLGHILSQKLLVSEDYFSIDLLLSSLFAPFKQISANTGSGGTLQMKMQAWFDKQFSRVFGAIIRLLIICVGVLWLAAQLIVCLIIFVLWPILPVLPVVGVVLSIGGFLL